MSINDVGARTVAAMDHMLGPRTWDVILAPGPHPADWPRSFDSAAAGRAFLVDAGFKASPGGAAARIHEEHDPRFQLHYQGGAQCAVLAPRK